MRTDQQPDTAVAVFHSASVTSFFSGLGSAFRVEGYGEEALN
jgi:hypothetical protein